jgi:hypothetical protein
MAAGRHEASRLGCYALMAGSQTQDKIGFGAASLDDFVVLKLVFVF